MFPRIGFLTGCYFILVVPFPHPYENSAPGSLGMVLTYTKKNQFLSATVFHPVAPCGHCQRDKNSRRIVRYECDLVENTSVRIFSRTKQQ